MIGSVKKIGGFTLIEIAIVLVIVTILLGYTMAMVPVQQEIKQYRQADAEMDRIIDSLYAFAQVNGYLPCPANDNVASSGFECRDNNGIVGDCDGNDPVNQTCDIWFGFVPGKTLGIQGKYSASGQLLDPWGMPYVYQVTAVDDDGDGRDDFVFQDEINDVQMENLSPDLEVCNTDPSTLATGNEGSCTDASETVVDNVPVVILSIGKDKALEGDTPEPSWIQRENQDNSVTDRIFIKTTRSNVSGAEFDDLIKWVSPNILYSKMIDAGQLP